MPEPTIFNKMAHPEPSLSADTRSMLHDEHSQRLEALEKKTNGLIQTRADHGHQFIVIIDRVKALEERVAALERYVADIHIASQVADPKPLPWEDLD